MEEDMQKLQKHQKTAAKLSFAEEMRTLTDNGRYAVISTISSENDGFPMGSVVGFAGDERGLPVFALSRMSSHTKDIKKNPNFSLTITDLGFQGASDARVTLTGRMANIPPEEVPAAREMYLAKHPDAFWVDFGDFTWHRMEELVALRLVGGFARAGGVSPDEYLASSADPISKFSAPIAGHMNADHADSTMAMVKHYVGIEVEEAMIASVDRLGMNINVAKEGESFKLRLPFAEPAEDRKSVKDRIVAMTRAAAAAEQ